METGAIEEFFSTRVVVDALVEMPRRPRLAAPAGAPLTWLVRITALRRRALQFVW